MIELLAFGNTKQKGGVVVREFLYLVELMYVFRGSLLSLFCFGVFFFFWKIWKVVYFSNNLFHKLDDYTDDDFIWICCFIWFCDTKLCYVNTVFSTYVFMVCL